jgi:hypothetical protein
MRINSQKELVTQLLNQHPHLRDDDNKLIATIWKKELKSNSHSALEFLQMYADKRLTNAESIRRCRAKIQELSPELRGLKYKARHEAAKETIEQLYNFI